MLVNSWKFALVVCPLLLCTLLSSACPLAADPSSAVSAQSTRLMQQMDHQRRLDAEKHREAQRAEAGRVQASSLPLADESSADLDYLIVVGLAASAAGIFIASKRKGRCVRPRARQAGPTP